jgi:hypothetical protein
MKVDKLTTLTGTTFGTFRDISRDIWGQTLSRVRDSSGQAPFRGLSLSRARARVPSEFCPELPADDTEGSEPMTDEARVQFNSDDPAFQHERAARRASRLSVYQCQPPPAVRRALAIEEATEATRRAAFAVIDARLGEKDTVRVEALKEIYVLLRMALNDLDAIKCAT